MEIANRVKLLINSLNLNQKKFAETVGISPARLNNYLSGVSNFPQSILVTISDTHNINLTWLITGTGPMFNNVPARELDHIAGSGKLITIPVVADIAAGIGIEAESIEPSEYLSIDPQLLPVPGPAYIFRVSGISMEPEIHTGDYVVISSWQFDQDYDGSICAFRSIDGLLLKRLIYNHGKKKALLVPLNPSQPIIPYDANSPDLILIGRLVAVIRKYT